ncbi:hypothetical protein BGX20_003408, partial [Mortierella sp. AD010]
ALDVSKGIRTITRLHRNEVRYRQERLQGVGCRNHISLVFFRPSRTSRLGQCEWSFNFSAEYNAEMEIFHATIKRQDILLAAIWIRTS